MIATYVQVLDTIYTIQIKRFDEDPSFKDEGLGGWCRAATREIILLDYKTAPGNERESVSACLKTMKLNLRHEIVHAFFNESGLQFNGLQYEGAWCKNEEMVDWFAAQGPKIYRAWREAGAL